MEPAAAADRALAVAGPEAVAAAAGRVGAAARVAGEVCGKRGKPREAEEPAQAAELAGVVVAEVQAAQAEAEEPAVAADQVEVVLEAADPVAADRAVAEEEPELAVAQVAAEPAVAPAELGDKANPASG